MTVTGPLNGVRVLDLTHVWAGPLAVRFLADLGADVVRVEAPDSRGPQQFPSEPIGGWLGGEHGSEPWNDNALFVKLMRNRRSLCLDLKQAQAKQVFLQLVSQADVLMENFSARAMPGLGLDYDTLKQANPRLIYVSMPGYGRSGPLQERVAFGPTVEAMSGFTQMMGYSPEEPRNTAMALMDPVTGTNAVAAVLTALRQRQQTGQGAMVEMSLHEGGVSYNGPWLIDLQLPDTADPACVGNAHPQMAPHGVYPCLGEDAWIALACANQAQWSALAGCISGLDATLTLPQRQAISTQIDARISAWTARHDKQQAAQLLQQAGVSAGPVNTVPDMVADPQVTARDYFVTYERFDVPMPGNPIRMPQLDVSEWQPCPRLGADNAAVLKEWLGMEATDLQALQGAGALADKPPA